MSRADLLDVNVWLALAHVHHPHHAAARRYWTASAVPMAFCRVSMQGFLRLVTQPAVMGSAVHTPAEAWDIYSAHLSTGRSGLISEPDDIDAVWQRLSTAQGFHVRDWTDTYLASFAICGGYRLVSFDAGFAKYQSKAKNQQGKHDAVLDFLQLRG